VSEARLPLIDWSFRTVVAQLQGSFPKSKPLESEETFAMTFAKLETVQICHLQKYLRQKGKRSCAPFITVMGILRLLSQKICFP
jgi:hypothetical protein